MTQLPSVVSCKVAALRPRGYADFSKWAAVPRHLYIGRAMVYVGAPASKWANPYSVKQYGRVGCLERYEAYVRTGPLWCALEELAAYAELGCWCAPEPCHGHVLLKLYEEKCRAQE